MIFKPLRIGMIVKTEGRKPWITHWISKLKKTWEIEKEWVRKVCRYVKYIGMWMAA